MSGKEGLSELVQSAYDLLNYYKEMGIKEIPMPVSVMKKHPLETLKSIREDIGDCTRCNLHKERTHIVFGEGNPNADLMFIGEGPGRDEDKTGRPFVGRAGQLLTKIIEAMKLKREDVFIANIVKCRPPKNRAPLPDEVATCEGFLQRQIGVVKPQVVVCLGSTAVQNLLKTESKISSLRGKFVEWSGVHVMPTYHPAFLLRNSNMKKPVWEDMKKVMKFLNIGKQS